MGVARQLLELPRPRQSWPPASAPSPSLTSSPLALRNEADPGVGAGERGDQAEVGFLPHLQIFRFGPQTGCPQLSLLGRPTVLSLPPSSAAEESRTLRSLGLPSPQWRRKGPPPTDHLAMALPVSWAHAGGACSSAHLDRAWWTQPQARRDLLLPLRGLNPPPSILRRTPQEGTFPRMRS